MELKIIETNKMGFQHLLLDNLPTIKLFNIFALEKFKIHNYGS